MRDFNSPKALCRESQEGKTWSRRIVVSNYFQCIFTRLDLFVNNSQDLRPSIPKDTPQEIVELMNECLSADPSLRPTFSQALLVIQSDFPTSENTMLDHPTPYLPEEDFAYMTPGERSISNGSELDGIGLGDYH